MKPLPRWFVGELFGTFLLVFFGCDMGKVLYTPERSL